MTFAAAIPAPDCVAPSIAIVGSGPSALYTLKHLVASLGAGKLVMFEAGDRPGVGTPYDERHNPPEMLANIASIELPPLHDSLLGWLNGIGEGRREALGIEAEHMDERHFFPRMVLGEYFSAGLAELVAAAKAKGLTVQVRTKTPVLDLVSTGGNVEVLYRAATGLTSEPFDYVVLATGHKAPRPKGRDDRMADPYRDAEATAPARRLGVLGSSLSAIDVAVSHALRFGRFEREDGVLTYVPDAGEEGRSITLMSRSGILPEADFFCPIPYLPLDIFTPAAIDAALETSEGALDRLFDLFKTQLAAADPAYADQVHLADATADDFADRYLAARKAANPFDWAAANLAEVRHNAEAGFTVPWRYAILRMHESFGAALTRMNDADVARFNAGMKGVFVDNYAAVPPLSIERILALHRAGVLDLIGLGDDYAMRCADDGMWTVQSGNADLTFDHLVDARGQGALGQDEFPFPTLRLQIRSASLLDGSDVKTVPLAEANALAEGSDPLARIFCLSLPFVMRRNPFVQGLTAAAEMGEAAARAICAAVWRDGVPQRATSDDIARLIEVIDETDTVLCGSDSGMVPLSVPRASAC